VNRSALPTYYTRLAPFLAVFRSGFPILAYHHIAERRRGARIKGLYVSKRLFDAQLGELRRANFGAGRYDLLSHLGGTGSPTTAPAPADERGGETGARPVFITFDDAFADVLANGLPVLQRHRFSGMLFVVASLVGKSNQWQERAGDVNEPLMTREHLMTWSAAGQEIGSHTLTHPRLTHLSREAAREEIVASKKSLEDSFGLLIRHFCYPYGDCNEQVRELVMEAGYETACTTVSGINRPGEDVFSLKRFTSRYASRNWRNLWEAFILFCSTDKGSTRIRQT
jgi:peptidoglycan/xylan/chitin deacetylase (PgdA/CDA1 family)